MFIYMLSNIIMICNVRKMEESRVVKQSYGVTSYEMPDENLPPEANFPGGIGITSRRYDATLHFYSKPESTEPYNTIRHPHLYLHLYYTILHNACDTTINFTTSRVKTDMYSTILNSTILSYNTLNCTTLSCSILHYTIQHYAVPYKKIYFELLHYTALYYTTLHFTKLHTTFDWILMKYIIMYYNLKYYYIIWHLVFLNCILIIKWRKLVINHTIL